MCVQTMEGTKPDSIVSSEILCMFNCRVLPTLRRHYKPEQVEQFEQKCKRFAQKLGLPAHQHYSITFPGFLNWDNDKRHPWAKRRLAWPRVPDSTLHELRAEVCKDILGHELVQPQPVVDMADADALAAYREEKQMYDDAVLGMQGHAEATGIDRYQERLWRKALTQDEYICISPLQTMQSQDCMPESNMPAEHAVRTVKTRTKDALTPLLPTELIKSGKVVQDAVNEIVRKRLNGANGRQHIQGSVAKMPLTFQILAGNEGDIVQLKYAEKDPDTVAKRKHEKTYSVRCTGGKWIRTKFWT